MVATDMSGNRGKSIDEGNIFCLTCQTVLVRVTSLCLHDSIRQMQYENSCTIQKINGKL